MKRIGTIWIFILALSLTGCNLNMIPDAPATADDLAQTYLPTVIAGSSTAITAIPDTVQTTCYSSSGQEVSCAGSGQDGAYSGAQPSYTDNGDGTVTDNVTGLIWSQTPDLTSDGIINVNDKLTYDQALARAESFTLAGYDDWRLPTITELYSLIDFNGRMYGSLVFANACGMRAMENWARLATGRKTVPSKEILGLRYQALEGDLRRAKKLRGVARISEFGACLAEVSRSAHPILGWSDPKPTLHYLVRLGLRLFGKRFA